MTEDLGIIRHTSPNAGVRPVDRTTESRAIAQGLDLTKQVIDEGVKASVTSDFLQAIEDVGNEGIDVFNTTPSGMAYDDPRANEFAHRIDRLNAVRAQGNVSQRNKAEMEIKGILNKAQFNYPWLATELQQRAGQVVAGSADLTRLGIADANRSAAAKNAQEEWDYLVELGQKRVKDGGLGIDPTIVPGSPAWIREFSERSKAWSYAETEDMITKNLATGGQGLLNDPNTVRVFSDYIRGRHSRLTRGIDAAMESSGGTAALTALASPNGGNQQAVEQFLQGGGAMDLQKRLAEERANVEYQFNDLLGRLPGYENHPNGKRLRADMDAALNYFDSVQTELTNWINGVPAAPARLAAIFAVKNHQSFLRIDDDLKPLWALYSSPTWKGIYESAQSIPDMEAVVQGLMTRDAAQTMWGQAFPVLNDPLLGHTVIQTPFSPPILGIKDDMSPEEVISQHRIHHVTPGQTYGLPTNDAAYLTAESYFANWTNGQLIGGDSIPIANESLNGLVTAYLAHNMRPGDSPPETMPRLLDMLAHPQMMEMVDASNQGGTNKGNIRYAFGIQARDFYASKYKPSEQRAKARDLFNNSFIEGRVLLKDVVRVDFEKIRETGSFHYEVDDKALARVPVTFGNVLKGNDKETLRQSIDQTMAKLEQQMNTEIQIERLINKALSMDGTTFRRTDDYIDYFFGVGSDLPQDSWARVFGLQGPF
jgi:hypothetical protein